MAEIKVQKIKVPIINIQYRRPTSSLAAGQLAYNQKDRRFFTEQERWVQMCSGDDVQGGKCVFYPDATSEPTTNWLQTTPDCTTATRDPATITSIKLHWGNESKYATGAPSWAEIYGVGDYIVLHKAGFSQDPYIFLIGTSSVAVIGGDFVEMTLGVSIVQPSHANITTRIDGHDAWVVDFLRG